MGTSIRITLTRQEATLIIAVLYRDASELSTSHEHVDANSSHTTAINKLLCGLNPKPVKKFNAALEAAIAKKVAKKEAKKKAKEKVKDEHGYASQAGLFN